MSKPADLLKEASDSRSIARLARRMARSLSLPADIERAIRYAEELEARAAELENEAERLAKPAP